MHWLKQSHWSADSTKEYLSITPDCFYYNWRTTQKLWAVQSRFAGAQSLGSLNTMVQGSTHNQMCGLPNATAFNQFYDTTFSNNSATTTGMRIQVQWSVLFQVIYRLGHPENCVLLLWNMVFIGSKFPKSFYFIFETKVTRTVLPLVLQLSEFSKFTNFWLAPQTAHDSHVGELFRQ